MKRPKDLRPPAPAPPPLRIYYFDEYCGQVGSTSTFFTCPECGRPLRAVKNDPNPAGWDYVCITCKKLTLTAEELRDRDLNREAAAAVNAPAGAVVVGFITAISITLRLDKLPGER